MELQNVERLMNGTKEEDTNAKKVVADEQTLSNCANDTAKATKGQRSGKFKRKGSQKKRQAAGSTNKTKKKEPGVIIKRKAKES